MTNRFIITLFILLLLISSCVKENTTDEKKNNKTAKVFYVENSSTKVPVIIVSGTPYEMGYQLGQAIKVEVNKCMLGFLEFAKQDAEKYSDANLDEAWEKMLPYIDSRFIEELKGVADGAEMSLDELRRANMIPVVSSFACSGVAVWGDATANGDLYHIRNLDFTMGAHLQDYPVIVVHKPDKGIPHIQTTFAGYIASHSGMNAKGVVLGERGESPLSEYPYNYDGIHFSLLFRSILYDANTLDETLDIIKNAKLIKRYFLYVSDGKKESKGAAMVIVSSPDDVKLSIHRDNEQHSDSSSKAMSNFIYHTVDDDIAYSNLNLNKGKFDVVKMINLSKLVAHKGENLLNIVYNASTLEMWVVYAHGLEDASESDYIYVNMNDYLK